MTKQNLYKLTDAEVYVRGWWFAWLRMHPRRSPTTAGAGSLLSRLRRCYSRPSLCWAPGGFSVHRATSRDLLGLGWFLHIHHYRLSILWWSSASFPNSNVQHAGLLHFDYKDDGPTNYTDDWLQITQKQKSMPKSKIKPMGEKEIWWIFCPITTFNKLPATG